MGKSKKNTQPTNQTLGAEKKQKEQGKNNGHIKERLYQNYKIIVRYFPYVLLTAIVVIGLGWFISARPHLPPTTMQKHIESSPSAHIISKPIPDSIQRHMLEHADGKGKPGVIMQYNCQKFTCESDFIQKLASLAAQYPDNVYLAPNSYDGKLILTKNGSLKILENFDEQAIKDFIE